MSRRWWMLSLALLAGPGWAGEAGREEAWVADYRIRDAQGERALVLVRDDTRVEYRVAGESTRVWRQTPDGVEMIELHPAERRRVVYTPGDLRTLGVQPDWALLTGLVDPALRARLNISGDATAFAQPLSRYRGKDAKGARVELDWLAEAGLPARYCVGESCAGKHRDADAIRLQQLTRLPAEGAFTSLDGLLEIDHADLGDSVDASIRDLSHTSSHAH